ncbi:MAG: hypothetical protein EOM19_03940 [Candidatus Moranbacteria bacterium]|nr:hypothetical protein [Candidatus Moranbacteria bacterium]
MKKRNVLLGVLGLTVAGLTAYSAQTLAYRGDPSTTGPSYIPERHEQMEKAFENNDYQAWKSLMTGKGHVTEVINEDNFGKFSEMHMLMEEGKVDEANAIRAELGLGQGKKQGNEQGCGNGQGKGRQ